MTHAQFLNDASEIPFAKGKGYWDWVWSGDTEDVATRKPLQVLTLEMPIEKPNVEIPVIELVLK